MKLTLIRIALLGVIVASYGYWVADADPVLRIADVSQVGWWTQRPGAQPVGEGKAEVASSVRGNESVAALRVLIRGEITKATVVLAETDAPLSAVSPGQVRVCTTQQPWLMVDGGKWADAPKPDCGQGVELTRATDPTGAAAWSGDVTSLLAGPRSEVSLMIVASEKQSSALASNWFFTFAPRITAEGTPDVPSTTVPAAPPSTVISGGAPTVPRVTSSPATVAPTPTTAVAAVATPAPADANQPRRFQVTSSHRSGKPWGKLIWPLLPLAALLAFAYTFGQQYVRERSVAA